VKVLVGATLVALAVGWVLERRVSMMALVGCVAVAFFGGLSVWFDNDLFIKIKPTVLTCLLAAIIAGGRLIGRNPLGAIIGTQLRLSEAGWRAISWLWGGSNQAGLAVLLDGPQGVSGNSQGLGVSLLRGPTWPDPSADQGWHRLRLALMPTTGGWHRAAVAAQARRFRQPLWRHPAAPGPAESKSWLAWPDPHQQWLGFEPANDGNLQWQSQNLSPCRSQWPAASGPWQIKQWPWALAQSS